VTHGPGAFMSTKLLDIDQVVLLPWAKPFDGPEWMFEPKYDGFRGLLHSSAAGCQIRSRGAHRAERFADLRDRVARVLGGRQAVLDGDIVALDAKGKPVFRDLLKGRGYLAFAASDLLWLDGRDLRPLPLTERKRRLTELLPSDTGPLYKIFTLEEHGRALFEASRKLDLEGIVAKRAADPYASETLWYLIRNPTYRQSETGSAAPPRHRRRGLTTPPAPAAAPS
jgi:bifunctional non-homologous end joining protein LigD